MAARRADDPSINVPPEDEQDAPGDPESAVALIDPDSERDAARRLVAHKLPALRGLPEQTQARRLVGLLARRGYSPSMAGDVVREALAGWIGPGVADALVAD